MFLSLFHHVYMHMYIHGHLSVYNVHMTLCSFAAQGTFDPTKLPCSASQAYLRATGPKSVHAPRTLHFLPPEQYRAQKLQQRALQRQLMADYLSDVGWGEEEPLPQQVKSFLAMKSLQFGGVDVNCGAFSICEGVFSSHRLHGRGYKSDIHYFLQFTSKRW